MRYDSIIDSMTWSFSRLSCYETCPYQWLMKYLLGIEDRPKFFTQYGKFLHSILERYLTGRLDPDGLPSYFLSHFREEVTARAPSTKIYLSYLDQGRQFLRALPLPDRETLAVEQELRFTVSGKPFVGFADWINRDRDGLLCLTDHKSRNLKPRSTRKKPTKTDRELDAYLRQLYLYSKPIQEQYGRFPDRLEFNCFRSQVWISEPFDPVRYQDTLDWAAALIERITTESGWIGHEDYWYCKEICGVSDECEYVN